MFKKNCFGIVGGVCSFLCSVSTSVNSSFIAQSFIWQIKDSTPSRHEGGPTAKERLQSVLAPSFYSFVFSLPWACPMQIGVAKKGVCLFHLKFSLRSMDFLLFHFHRLSPFFVFWPQPLWTPFSYSNYLTGLYTVNVSIHPTSIMVL